MSDKIGQRIKNLRKSAHMTQAHLAGNVITRNMLSLIENGKASPSIQTLEYLSKRLGVPMARFFSSAFDEELGLMADKKNEIQKLYMEKKYKDCEKILDRYYIYSNKDIPDELLLIGAEVCMYLGRRYTLKGSFDSAAIYLSKALEYSQKCIYATEWIDANVFIYQAVIENTDCPLQALDTDYFMKIRRAVGYEYFNYLKAVKMIDENKGEEAAQFLKQNKIIEPAHKEHINAKFMMLSENNDIKSQALDTLCNMIKRAPSYPLDAISRFLILKDIEYAARAIDNYEIAYKYASMRLKIVSEMRD